MSPFLASAVEGCWPAAVAAGAGFAVLPWLKRDSTSPRARRHRDRAGADVALHAVALVSTLPPFGFTLDTLTALLFIAVETAAVFGATISFFFLTACATAPPRSKPTWAG